MYNHIRHSKLPTCAQIGQYYYQFRSLCSLRIECAHIDLIAMLFTLLCLFAAVTIVAFVWQQHQRLVRHFDDRGVAANRPWFLLGNTVGLVFRCSDYTRTLRDLYAQYRHKG